jgi:hypothetical protein
MHPLREDLPQTMLRHTDQPSFFQTDKDEERCAAANVALK